MTTTGRHPGVLYITINGTTDGEGFDVDAECRGCSTGGTRRGWSWGGWALSATGAAVDASNAWEEHVAAFARRQRAARS